jgi:hypothetical protein
MLSYGGGGGAGGYSDAESFVNIYPGNGGGAKRQANAGTQNTPPDSYISGGYGFGTTSFNPPPANRGGGGGGAGGYQDSEGNVTSGGAGQTGASGIIIKRYKTGSMTATGGAITTFQGDTIHTFTSNGDFERLT